MKKQNKPRFIAYVAASADGRISVSSKKLPDWTSREDSWFLQRSLRRADAVVAGRNTYLAAKGRLAKRNSFILTSRVGASKKIGPFTFVNPARADLRKIFAGYRQVAVLGGARVYGTMLERGLLDEVYVTIEPLIFGHGVEMFRCARGVFGLRLLSARHLNKRGTLLLRYRVR